MSCVCGKPAASKCAQCDVKYCSRECQVSAWRQHKMTCVGQLNAVKQNAINKLHEKIYGNIMIVYAHSGENSYIKVELNESIEEYILTDTHFAHLSACTDVLNETNYCNAKITKNLNLPYAKILFKFTNYSFVINSQLNGTPEVIRSKYPAPDDVWSILL